MNETSYRHEFVVMVTNRDGSLNVRVIKYGATKSEAAREAEWDFRRFHGKGIDVIHRMTDPKAWKAPPRLQIEHDYVFITATPVDENYSIRIYRRINSNFFKRTVHYVEGEVNLYDDEKSDGKMHQYFDWLSGDFQRVLEGIQF